MYSERCAVVELFKAGKSPQIKRDLNIPSSRRRVVYRTINRFKETGETSDRLRSGRPCSITTPAFKKVVRERIRRNPCRSMRKMALELRETIPFQQDGAPAHTSNSTQGCLRENIPDFIRKEEWPPYSPYLNPMDYSMWGILESRACSKPHKNILSLKSSLCREWEKIPMEMLRAAVQRFPERLKAVISKRGGYIE